MMTTYAAISANRPQLQIQNQHALHVSIESLVFGTLSTSTPLTGATRTMLSGTHAWVALFMPGSRKTATLTTSTKP